MFCVASHHKAQCSPWGPSQVPSHIRHSHLAWRTNENARLKCWEDQLNRVLSPSDAASSSTQQDAQCCSAKGQEYRGAVSHLEPCRGNWGSSRPPGLQKTELKLLCFHVLFLPPYGTHRCAFHGVFTMCYLSCPGPRDTGPQGRCVVQW